MTDLKQDPTQDLEARFERFSTNTTTPDEAIALFEEGRSRCPVAHSGEVGGFHLPLRYDDIRAAHRDPETFASGPVATRPISDRPPFPPLEMDEPIHGKWRELFNRGFNVSTPERMEPLIRHELDALLDEFAARGTVDLVAELAERLPVLTLCHVIGVDREQRGELRRLSIQVIRSLVDPVKGPAAFAELAQFGVAQVHARRADPQDDFLSEIATSEIDGQPLTDFEIGMLMNSLMTAGSGTTVGGMSTLFLEVLSQPEVKQRLIDDPSLIPAAVEENMRLNTPFFGLYRRATRPTSLGGVEIAEGESLFMCWASANRDPERFENPNDFDLDRKRNRHMTFGFGIHACPGAPTARLQMRLGLEHLLARFPDIALDADRPGTKVFGGTETLEVDALHATFTPQP